MSVGVSLGCCGRGWRSLFQRIASSVLPGSGPEDRYSALAYRRVPLLGTLIRYSEAGSSPPHANPLFRMWATPPTCGTGGPRAEQAAQFRSPWGLMSSGLRHLAVLGERLRRLRRGCLRAAVRGVQRLGYRATRAGVIVVAHESFLSHPHAEHDAVATQASSRGSRNERLDFLIGDADQHVVKDPGEACGPREVFRRGRRTIGGVNDVAVSVLGAEGPDI